MYRIASKSRSAVGTSHTSTRRGRVALRVVLLALAAQAPRTALAQTAAPTLPATPAPSAALAAPVGAEALARCERAVRQALFPQAGAAAEVRFSVTPPVPRSLSDGSQIVLQGEAQWREAAALRKFKYSCNLDSRSGEAIGVVIRQTDPPLAAQAESKPIMDPDLSHLSPSACESGAAAALQQRWPRVSQITFDSETRSLTQQSALRAELHGQGRARTAPESPALVHFGFDCTIDPRDGRVIGMSLSG
jgi:hypothetical protein